MTTTRIKNGTIVDAQGERKQDIIFDTASGKLLSLDTGLEVDVEIDAKGCIITPGLVDIHSHLRQPGNEAAETIESGSRSAALGGYTAVVAMPNTTPCMDTPAVIAEVANFAKSALCEIKPSAAITVGREGLKLSPMGELVELGVCMFTDDGTGVQDAAVMRKALEYLKGVAAKTDQKLLLSQHCEVSALSQGGVMHEGEWSSKLGLGGQPSEAEELMVARDIALARLTGMHVHMQHLSTAGSVELVRQAKAESIPVTAEATPHHFTLTDAACANFDTAFKVHPPLRTSADVAAVREGLADGTIDVIATDHAPHTADSKDLPFDQAPPGMIGLETAFALTYTELDLDLTKIIDLLSITPAQIGGLDDRHGCVVEPGAPANLAVIDLEHEWQVDGVEMASKSRNTPFQGRKVTGKVRHTIFDGEVVVKDGKALR